MSTITLAEFWDQLSRHDWYHAMSDDHGVWRAGEKDLKRLASLASEGGQQYQDLLDGFRGHYFTGRPWGNKQLPKPPRPER